MTNVKSMPAADLVAHLHPDDQPSREHTLAAVAQIRELVRYLASVAGPYTASKALPAPNVVSDVALILRDAMAAAAAGGRGSCSCARCTARTWRCCAMLMLGGGTCRLAGPACRLPMVVSWWVTHPYLYHRR